uniref:Putative secreted protein n=1 Tax=Anopheles triannulatus TaxID=58253 RepID=A0A2M4B4M6_9DIPT
MLGRFALLAVELDRSAAYPLPVGCFIAVDCRALSASMGFCLELPFRSVDCDRVKGGRDGGLALLVP